MKVSIRDVAKRAKVSPTTVSLVLNQKADSISQKTQEAVFKAAHELNYSPNQLARGLVTKSSKIIGVLVPDIKNPFFADLAQEIDLAAKQRGYVVILGETLCGENTYLSLINMMIGHQVEGIVVAKSTQLTLDEEIQVLTSIREQGVHLVSIDSNLEDDTFNSVYVDHRQGAYMATKHLLELGHKRIGCITGPSKTSTSTYRVLGYGDALGEYGVPYDEELLFRGDYSMDHMDKALQYFLDLNVTAIFAFNDMMALGIYRAANRSDIKIPDELSVVGFDDINVSEIVYPSLTTVNQGTQAIADASLQILDDEINLGRSTSIGVKRYLTPELVIRCSTKKYNSRRKTSCLKTKRGE